MLGAREEGGGFVDLFLLFQEGFLFYGRGFEELSDLSGGVVDHREQVHFAVFAAADEFGYSAAEFAVKEGGGGEIAEMFPELFAVLEGDEEFGEDVGFAGGVVAEHATGAVFAELHKHGVFTTFAIRNRLSI